MPPVGPQLPPHLQKRKRTPESDAAPGSPPSKMTRRGNEDEIALDDDSSDDGFGPSIGPTMPTSNLANGFSRAAKEGATRPAGPRPAIGPTLPPTHTNKDEISIHDDDDSDHRPAPGPKRMIGPAPPPNDLSTRPTTAPDSASDSDSDSDSDYGPAPPPTGSPTSSSRHRAGPASPPPPLFPSLPEAPKRDDWMLAPPTSSGARDAAAAVGPDPTKLRARKFASGRAAAASEAHAGGVSSIWTETPEEKRKRLADAVLGRGGDGDRAARAGRKDDGRRLAAGGGGGGDASEERIRSYTEQTRGKSLYEEHQLRKKAAKEGGGGKEGAKDEEEDDDDPSKRAFNWEKDMKAGATISHSKRRELLTRSANFGDRFQKGNYL